MDDIARRYLKSIHERLGYHGSWLPNRPSALGDVGILRDGVFERRSSLANLSVEFKTRPGTKPMNLSHTSEGGVDIAIKAKGEALQGANIPRASAGASLKFSAKGGFVFQAVDCYVDEIDDQLSLGATLLHAHRRHSADWERDWCVVHAIVRAGSATIAISRSDGARLDLSAKTNIGAGDLAKADAGLAVSNQSGDVFHAVAERGLKPLFKISRIRRRWFDGHLHFGGLDSAQPGAILEEVAPAWE